MRSVVRPLSCWWLVLMAMVCDFTYGLASSVQLLVSHSQQQFLSPSCENPRRHAAAGWRRGAETCVSATECVVRLTAT